MIAETEECIDQQERQTGRARAAGDRGFVWEEHERLHDKISIIVRPFIHVACMMMMVVMHDAHEWNLPTNNR